MSKGLPRFSKGQNIKYLGTGKIGTVNEILEGQVSYQYKITVDGEIRTVSERFLEPIQDEEENLLEDFSSNRVGDHSDYQTFNIWYRLSKPLGSNLYSYLGSRTLFNPYQFRPLLRLLHQTQKIDYLLQMKWGWGRRLKPVSL